MASATVDNEINYVKKATALDGDAFVQHLKTKGFVDPAFAGMWSSVTTLLANDTFGPRILDLGCGPGWTSIFLAGRGLDVVGADVSPDMLEIARENANRMGMNIDFQTADMQGGFHFAQPFDGVLIFDALHHCQDEVAVLRHCFANLVPGGKILLVEPDWFHEYSPSSAHDRKNFGTTERGMGWLRVRKALKKAGFVDPQRFYNVALTAGHSPWQRLKAIGIAALTVTIGFPHRPTIVLARKP